MATINLSVAVPDAQLPRVQAAARATFGQVDDGAGGLRDMTNNEVVARLKFETVQMIKSIVHRHEKAVLVAAAEAPIADVDAT
jgi:hypothetical protein